MIFIMGIVDTLINSIVQVVAGILGFVLFVAGGQQAAFGSGIIGPIMAFIGVVLLVFAAKM